MNTPAVGKPNCAIDCIIAVDESLNLELSIVPAPILPASITPVVNLVAGMSGMSPATRS